MPDDDSGYAEAANAAAAAAFRRADRYARSFAVLAAGRLMVAAKAKIGTVSLGHLAPLLLLYSLPPEQIRSAFANDAFAQRFVIECAWMPDAIATVPRFPPGFERETEKINKGWTPEIDGEGGLYWVKSRR